MGLKIPSSLATIFDGITRHSPEGLNFKHRAERSAGRKPFATAIRELGLDRRTGRSIRAAGEGAVMAGNLA